MRCVTVPGASFRGPQDPERGHEPLVVFIEGGVEALGYRLAEEIRQQLRFLESRQQKISGIQDPKSWDVT